MRVAVVTPYYKDTVAQLERCMRSVQAQTYGATHIMVADGHPQTFDPAAFFQHITLPYSHKDAGATPRAIGALSAFSQGFDAVAFLDADNWYAPHHIDTMINVAKVSNADAVVATRTIHALDGTPMYVDRVESNGENMVDTNSWFILRKAMHIMPAWIVDPGQRLWSDRHFTKAMFASGIGIVRSDEPTVAYATKWAWHYKHANLPIPDDAVWIDTDASGNLIHRRHGDQQTKGT